MRNRITVQAILALLTLALPVAAAPSIEMNVVTEREVENPETGERQRITVTEAEPGAELIYTLRYANRGDEAATDVVIENAIPQGVVFLNDVGPAPARPLFSIDGGATFGSADELTHEVELSDGRRVLRPAGPEQYTHVRWVIDRVAEGRGGDLLYRVRVK